MASTFPATCLACLDTDDDVVWVVVSENAATLFSRFAVHNDFERCVTSVGVRGLLNSTVKKVKMVYNADWDTDPRHTVYINPGYKVVLSTVDKEHQLEGAKPLTNLGPKDPEPATNPPEPATNPPEPATKPQEPFMQIPGDGAKTLATLMQLGRAMNQQAPGTGAIMMQALGGMAQERQARQGLYGDGRPPAGNVQPLRTRAKEPKQPGAVDKLFGRISALCMKPKAKENTNAEPTGIK